MSRAYRIRVRETLRRVIRAEDHVRSQLELLAVLPADQMADLLAEQLVARGFEREGNTVVRQRGPVSVTVDLETGEITVRAEDSQTVDVAGEKDGIGYDRAAGQIEETLRRQLIEGLERDVAEETDDLQRRVTDKLEGILGDLRAELDQAVNRATAEALKQKAASLGQIKEMTDDPETGSLTIVLEV